MPKKKAKREKVGLARMLRGIRIDPNAINLPPGTAVTFKVDANGNLIVSLLGPDAEMRTGGQR